MEDWVRARALKAALAQAVAVGQLQFHWESRRLQRSQYTNFHREGAWEEAAAVCTFRWRLRGARICVHFYGECRSLQAGKQLTE